MRCIPNNTAFQKTGLVLSFLLGLTLPLSVWAGDFKIQTWETSNGVPVHFYPAPEVPILDISLAFNAGSARDANQLGISALTNSLINQGNAGLSANTIANRLANTGAQLSTRSNRDMALLSLRTLTRPDALKPALTTFAQIINQPNFPPNAFSREQKQQLQAIEQIQESPDAVANMAFFKAVYPHHPYGYPTLGTKQSVSALTKERVNDFYHRYYVADNAYLVLVGAIDTAQAHAIAEQLVADLPDGDPAPPLPKAESTQKPATHTLPFPSTQTMLRLGQVGIDYHDPDYFPLMVGNYILGGGSLVSRLGLEIRENRGLTYGVTSQFAPMLAKGPFVISLSTKNQKALEAQQLSATILKDFIEKGPLPKEVTAAKNFLTGSFPLSLASNRAIAAVLLKMSFYDLPIDYLNTYRNQIQAVTQAEIQQAFQRHIQPNALQQIIVGPK